MIGDFFDELVSLPFKLARIPAEFVREAGSRLDPDDDVGINEAAEQLANLANIPFDSAIVAIRKAVKKK